MMVRLFPNKTAAQLHADSNPPVPLAGEVVLEVKPVPWHSAYALRVTLRKGAVQVRRYYRES